MISWLDATEHQRFGERLAAFVIEKMPVPAVTPVTPATPGARAGKKPRKPASPQDVIRKMVLQISEFTARNGANIYKKAKFGNTFKWKLLEAGYDAEFADELTKELLIHFR